MPSNSRSLTSPSSRTAVSMEKFLRLLLLRGTATRQEIGRHSGFSSASVTLGSQWLLENDILRKSTIRVASSKRPVEQLALRTLPWSLLAMRLSATGVLSDLLDSTGEVIESFDREIPDRSQAAIFAAIGEELRVAQSRGEETGKPVLGLVLSVDGLVSEPEAGIIFHLNGLAGWVPCAPKAMHPAMTGMQPVIHWTRIVCKLHGLARQLGTDDSIAYFEVLPRDLHFATMHRGVVTRGRLGTSGDFLHQTVQASGPACFCGRPGCLDARLRAGKASSAMIYSAIQRLLEQRQIRHVGIEWRDAPASVKEAFRGAPLHTVVSVSEGHETERQGLALLGTEAALLHLVDRLQQQG
ncbi:MAG: ROK family protein [Opitutaceae bacterium]|nr:ROK family protein [Opitutaceae bacterium]